MCKKFKFYHTNKWYIHSPAAVRWNFDIQTDHRISTRKPDLIIINRKKSISKIVDFAVPADHRKTEKKCKKKDKYLDLARELKKKLWKMKVTSITIVIGVFGTVTKGLLKGLGDEWRPSKLQQYWERPEYWEESWRLEETCCHSNSSERQLTANTDVKNSKRSK